ncbi:MAG: hypothetical protein ACYS22_16915 [Planctomycetota bacterium]|jgi:hypothetical protein
MARRRYRPSEPEGETRFADIAPTFDHFPGFDERDFSAFVHKNRRDPTKNGVRLIVKRKLAALGSEIEKTLKPKKLDLTMRTSLSHPFKHNGFSVGSQWVYWGRSDKAKRAIKKALGADLGQDLDPTYQGVVLLVEVNDTELSCGLKIHPKAWWDGQNLKRRVESDSDALLHFTQLINGLPAGYAMNVGGFRKRYEAGSLSPAAVANFFRYYKPGEHWLELLHRTPKAQAIEAGAGLSAVLAERLGAAADTFQFALWSKKNNAVL